MKPDKSGFFPVNPFQLIFRVVSIFTFFLSGVLFAYTPKAGSALANHEHPRLHVTPQTRAALNNALAQHFSSEYQSYVNWANSTSDGDQYNVLYESGHDPLRALMVHQAFIAMIGEVSGISYPISLESYASRAINRLISRLNAGEEISYVAALVYDWTYHFQTPAQRSQIAGLMKTRNINHKVFSHSIANPDIQPEQMFSSKYFECCYAWYIGLAFWGDGLMDTEADNAVDSFYDTMLNYGYLDAMNFVAGEGGGFSEWIGYSSWHPRTHFLHVDGWFTATGENYMNQAGTVPGNATVNYAKFMHYAIDPHKYFNDFYCYMMTGDASTTDTSLEHGSMQEQMLFLVRTLYNAGRTQEAGLMRHMIEEYEVGWLSYHHFYNWGFLGAYRMVNPVTPEELQMKKWNWSKNLGLFHARTGFDSNADAVLQISDSHFQYDGHDGNDDYPGFGMVKHGELFGTRNVGHRGYGNLENYVGAHEDNVVFFEGGHEASRSTMDTPAELKSAATGQGNFDWGGIEQVTAKDGYFYQIRSRRDRSLADNFKHTREFIWVPGENERTDSEFLIVYDRTSSTTKPEWIYHMPWLPQASGYTTSENITTGSGTSDRKGTAYNGSNIILTQLNSTGDEFDNDGGTQSYVGGGVAHGVAFVKTLLPSLARIEVSRVAQMDSEVMKRQAHLAIKSHRWQVSVKPQSFTTNERFLNVFQTADADFTANMTNVSLLQSGSSMQGAWIERESAQHSNVVALFNYSNGVNANTFAYDLNGQGKTRHVITGLKPYTTYKIDDVHNGSTTTLTIVTEPEIELWDYKGVDTNTTTGTLYFETTLSGAHTFSISVSGTQDTSAPGTPQSFKVKKN